MKSECPEHLLSERDELSKMYSELGKLKSQRWHAQTKETPTKLTLTEAENDDLRKRLFDSNMALVRTSLSEAVKKDVAGASEALKIIQELSYSEVKSHSGSSC
jgi:hypothetical protein